MAPIRIGPGVLRCHRNMTAAEVRNAVNAPAFVNGEERQAVVDPASHVLAIERPQ